MKPLASFPAAAGRGLIGLLTDIDDTITTDGRLPAAAYAMLERLSEAGLRVIPVTGRPAGWCDMVARFWPVDGVIGENGALAFRYDHAARRMRRTFAGDARQRDENRKRLTALGEEIVAKVPGAAIASDQVYRESDLAIDFSEDVAPLGPEAVKRIVALLEEAGATAKVSSIHVNAWFGDWDKLSMARVFLQEEFGLDLDAERDRFVYCGDSPNDAPMFGFFPLACGVANVRDFAGSMTALPAFVAPSRGADGFVEIAETILAARR